MSIDILARQIERAAHVSAQWMIIAPMAMGKVNSSFYVSHFRTVEYARGDRLASDRPIDRSTRFTAGDEGGMRPSNPFALNMGFAMFQASIFPFTASFPFDQAFCVLTNIRDALLA
jgi:hypothetical protein